MTKSFLPAAFAAVVLTLSPSLYAQDGQANTPQAPIRGESKAMTMVPARVELKEALDAGKSAVGAMFHAKLLTKITLSDGTVLPAGTMLTGSVVADDMQRDEPSKLALRFTSAMTKDGRDLPVRATIIDVQKPVPTTDIPGDSDAAARETSARWTPKTLQVDQLDVLSGVDLHSAIASRNSGIFVSKKGKDVKLAAGSQLAIALAPAPQAQAGM